jgi:hypothetical protein
MNRLFLAMEYIKTYDIVRNENGFLFFARRRTTFALTLFLRIPKDFEGHIEYKNDPIDNPSQITVPFVFPVNAYHFFPVHICKPKDTRGSILFAHKGMSIKDLKLLSSIK